MAVFLKIALAAVIHGASKNGHNLDTYVTEVLFVGEKDDEDVKQQKLGKIIEAVRSKFFKICRLLTPFLKYRFT